MPVDDGLKDRFARYRAKNRERLNAKSAAWWAKNGAAYREANQEKETARHAKYREENREAIRDRFSQWHEENPGKEVEYSAAYRARNPEKRRTTCANYRANNPEKERASRAKWAAANKDRLAAKSAARRALKLQATPAWVEWEAINAFYADAQARTAATGQPYHVDHIVPLKSKLVCGLHCLANLRVIPGIENLTKGNRSWPDMP